VLLLILSSNVVAAPEFEHIDNDNPINDKINSSDTLEQLVILSEFYWATDRKKSDSLISLAFNTISKNQPIDSILLADAYHMLGKVLINKKESKSGIEALKKSLLIKQNISQHDHKSLAKTLNYIGRGYLGLQKFDSTIYYCNSSKEQLINNNIKDINLYYTFLNIGISHASLGKYNLAVDYFDTALIALTESGKIIDSLIIAGYYYNYALLTTLTGNLKEANENFEKAEALYSNKLGGDNIILAGINNNKGINSYYDFEFSKAELFYKKALDIYIANNENIEGIPRMYNNLSQVSQDMGDYISSINYCLSGLKYLPGNDLKLILNKNIARSYAAIGDNEKASYYFENALALLKEENINPKRYQELYSSYADFLYNINNNSLCINYYKKALQSANQLYGSYSDQSADILSQIGAFYLNNINNADSAIFYYNKSISTFNKNKGDTEGANLNIVQEGEAQVGYASALLLKFKQTRNIEQLTEADTIFMKVLSKMEKIRNNLSNDNKLLLIELIDPVYNLAINNSYELYKYTNDTSYIENIFNYIEKNKSSALLSAVNTENALKTSDLPEDTFKYEHLLKDEINGLSQLLENENTKENPNNNKINFFENKLLNLIVTYDSLILAIEQNYPKYYSVKYDRSVINVADIKNNLKDDEAIIEYQLADSVLYLLTFTKNDFNIKEVAIDTNFYNSLKYIISIKEIDLNSESNRKFNEFMHNSHKLWKTLIEPVNSLLNNKRLIIIPDDLLGYLPFDLLIEYDFETDSINYRDLPYLIKSHPISYSYSATLKYNTYFNTKKKKPTHNILAFAPLYSENNSGLMNLPFAKKEVLSIVNNQGGRAFYDDQATKENFLKHAGSNNILHLAMHAIINDSLPMQSKLVFYNDNSNTTSNYMFTHEIFNMDLNASMVTLSACNTGTGKFSKGEGIMSLARGVIYAGVPSIVMTLWEVQDASGSIIMDKYYDYLSQGMTKDIALQQAKLNVLLDANMAKSHPFFWSSYIINGDASEIEIRNYSSFYYYWIIAFLLILIIVIVSHYRPGNLSRRID